MAVMSVGREVILWPERVLFFAVRQLELGEIRGKGEELTRPQIGWEESNRRREVGFCRRGLHPLEHKDVLHHP